MHLWERRPPAAGALHCEKKAGCHLLTQLPHLAPELYVAAPHHTTCRGMHLEDALIQCRISPKKAAGICEKVCGWRAEASVAGQSHSYMPPHPLGLRPPTPIAGAAVGTGQCCEQPWAG